MSLKFLILTLSSAILYSFTISNVSPMVCQFDPFDIQVTESDIFTDSFNSHVMILIIFSLNNINNRNMVMWIFLFQNYNRSGDVDVEQIHSAPSEDSDDSKSTDGFFRFSSSGQYFVLSNGIFPGRWFIPLDRNR